MASGSSRAQSKNRRPGNSQIAVSQASAVPMTSARRARRPRPATACCATTSGKHIARECAQTSASGVAMRRDDDEQRQRARAGTEQTTSRTPASDARERAGCAGAAAVASVAMQRRSAIAGAIHQSHCVACISPACATFIELALNSPHAATRGSGFDGRARRILEIQSGEQRLRFGLRQPLEKLARFGCARRMRSHARAGNIHVHALAALIRPEQPDRQRRACRAAAARSSTC